MTRQRNRGYSLVELMIAITLGLILMAGVVSVFVNNKQAFRAQESGGRLQENLRFASEILGRYIRQADFWSGVRPTSFLASSPAVTDYGTGSTCVASWITDATQGVRGYAGGGSSPLDCVAAADYVSNSDMLAVRYVDPNSFCLSGGASNPLGSCSTSFSSSKVYLRTSVARNGYLFVGDSSGTSNADVRIAQGDGVFNYEYHASVLFLRPCSTKSGTTCASTDDGGSPIPTLVALDLQGLSMSQQPLVENVEMMKLLYGVDSNGDLAVDIYCSASDINSAAGSCPNNWNDVMSVRIGLVVRGDSPEALTDTQTYTLPGGFTYGPAGCSTCSATYSAAAARYSRRVIVKDVQIRNRTRLSAQ